MTRLQAARANHADFREDIEDMEDFMEATAEEAAARIGIMKDTVDLLERMRKHNISWEHLLRHVHTLRPRTASGSATADISDAD